jgi:hypothetical protein
MIQRPLGHGKAAFHSYGMFAGIAVNDLVDVRSEALPSQVYAGPYTDSIHGTHDFEAEAWSWWKVENPETEEIAR